MRVFGIIITLLFFHFSSLSQNKCVEMISDDNKPVQYVSVVFKKDRSVFVSNDKGYLCDKFVSKIKTGDTVLVTAIGFQNRELVYSGNDTIVLQRRFVVLPEAVLVKGEGVKEIWGTKKNPGFFGLFGCRQIFTEILSSTARIIYPEGNYKKAEIVSVSFYDKTGKDINVPVRVRVYLIGKDSLPYADYLTENLIVNTTGKGWLEVELKNRGLVFPKEGLAFGIELFATGDEYYYTEIRKTKTGKKVGDRVYGFSLAREKDTNALTMTKFQTGSNNWYVERSGFGPYCGDLVCRVKVKVWR